ncbi:MAG: FIST C-terminal domain-containing protein, partial [Sulfurimonas sp.]|nr:FIST C-terminal domain-containing protein [Sulfurimonas sp.]
GSTTDGEIKDGLVSTHKTVVSFTVFEKTTLKTHISNSFNSYFEAGSTLMNNLNEKNTKVIISFIDGLQGNGDYFLNGIDSVNGDVIVAGGLAGDNATSEGTYVFTKDNICKNGVVGVGLSSDCLNVTTNYSFNWITVGVDLKITKAVGNRVYTINDKTAYEAYSYYLGEKTAKALPAIGVEFPLVTKRNGINIARTVISSEIDGSLIFGGNLKEGDIVKFGYGDREWILDNVKQNVNKIVKNPVESIFIYSGRARRRFMPELIKTEILPYNEIAPVAGFFTNGAFYTSSQKELLNQSMTILSLSESDDIKENISFNDKVDINKNNSIKSLSHLMKVSSNELETLNIMLENRVEDEIEKNREKTKQIIEQKQLFETIFNKSKDGFLILEDDKFIDCNNAAVDMLIYGSKEDILNKHPFELSPEFQLDGSSSSEKLMEYINKALKNGSYDFEWVHKKANGDDIWIDIVLSDISTEDKTLLFVVWRDIDDKKKTEAKLEELNTTLESRVKEEVEKNSKKENEHKDLKLAEQKAKDDSVAKSSFLANMSHEIRTPMNAIIGFIDILVKNETSDEKLAKLNIIKKSSSVLLEIINDILDFSK